MTGRADHGSQAWLFPSTLSYQQTYHPRRGATSEVLDGLRRLQGGAAQQQPITPAPEGQPLPPSALWRRLVAGVRGRYA